MWSCNEKVKVNSEVPKNYKTVNKKGSTEVVQASAKESILDEELTLEERLVYETRASVERVEKAIEYAVSKNAKNVLAYAKNTIDKNWDAKNNMETKKGLNFCNYRQREYDFDELERKLLEWD